MEIRTKRRPRPLEARRSCPLALLEYHIGELEVWPEEGNILRQYDGQVSVFL